MPKSIRYALDQNLSEQENKDFLKRKSILCRLPCYGYYKGNNTLTTVLYTNVGYKECFLEQYIKSLQESTNVISV